MSAPRVIIVDRSHAQAAALEREMPESQVVFCYVHLQRSIQKNFGRRAQEVAEVFDKFVTKRLSRHDYMSKLRDKFGPGNEMEKAVANLLDDIDFYDPGRMTRMRGQRSSNLVEGYHGILRRRIGDGELGICQVVQEIDKIYQQLMVRSYRNFFELPQEIWRGPELGAIAARTIQSQVDLARRIRNDILEGALTPSDSRLLNEACACVAQLDYGLPCVHVAFERLDEGVIPLLSECDIPDMYLRLSSGVQSRDRGTVSRTQNEDDVKEKWTYSQVMARLEPVAAGAPRNRNVRGAVEALLNAVQPELGSFPGRRVSRPAGRVGFTGQRRMKAKRTCSYCKCPGHNIATCKKRAGDERLSSSPDVRLADAASKASEQRAARRKERVKSFLSRLNPMQMELYHRYNYAFSRFLWQIAEDKRRDDIPTLNGVFLNQFVTIRRLVPLESLKSATDLVYQMNYGSEVPPEQRDHLSRLVDDIESGKVDLSSWQIMTDEDEEEDV